MLTRLAGDASSPASASFSSSSWNARLSASIAANVNVTQRILGAKSTVATAVGSRPKLNTVKTRAVNTTADTKAVRERNSSSKSLRPIAQACRSTSRTGHRLAIRLGDLGATAPGSGSEVHEAAARLERDVRGQLDALVHVVRRQHHDPPTSQLAQEATELRRRRQVDPGERLGPPQQP